MSSCFESTSCSWERRATGARYPALWLVLERELNLERAEACGHEHVFHQQYCNWV